MVTESDKGHSLGANKHCFHSMGFANGDARGGSDTFRCCWCNKEQVIFCKTEYHKPPGHGMYHRVGGITWRLPEDLCPQRISW